MAHSGAPPERTVNSALPESTDLSKIVEQNAARGIYVSDNSNVELEHDKKINEIEIKLTEDLKLTAGKSFLKDSRKAYKVLVEGLDDKKVLDVHHMRKYNPLENKGYSLNNYGFVEFVKTWTKKDSVT